MGIYQDFLNNKIVSLPINEVKANPSVYSPNGGGLNSEENLRWMVKRLTTKNYVVGNSVEEVNKSLNTTISKDSISLGDGIFSIDGYTFKLAESGHTSYDDSLNVNAENVSIDITDAKNFVMDITGTSKSVDKKLASNFEDFCFSNFLPTYVDYDETIWDKACNKLSDLKDRTVGYVRLTYEGDLTSDYNLTITSDGQYEYITYGDTNIRISNIQIDTIESGGKVIPDAIKNTIITVGDPFAIKVDGDTLNIYYNIYYPVFVKKDVDSTVEEVKMIVYFNDIYSLTYTHCQSFEKHYSSPSDGFGSITTSNTKFYPGAEQLTNIYIYPDMYNDVHSQEYLQRKSSLNNTIMGTEINFYGSTILSNFGLVMTQPLDIQELISAAQATDNGHTYICLDIDDSKKQEVVYEGTTYYVPVAFLVDDGTLCTDGYVYLDETTEKSTNLVVESYIHFLKRTCYNSQYSDDPTKTPENITVPEVCMWLQNNQSLMDDYLNNPISYFLNLCYSSALNEANIDSAVCNSDKKIISNAYKCMEFNTKKIISGIYNYFLTYDDPYNFLTRCTNTTLGESKLNINLTFVLNPSRYVTFENVSVDENFMPICKATDTGIVDNTNLNIYFNTDIYSLSNGLRFSYVVNTWYCNIPTVLTVQKDSHKYLVGKVGDYFTQTAYYGGLMIHNKFPNDINQGDLYLYNLNISSEADYIEQLLSPFVYVSLSQPVYVQRNAFLHTSKIYGDNNRSFEEVVKDLIIDNVSIDITDLEDRLRKLEIIIYGDDDNPGLQKEVEGDEDTGITGAILDIEDLEDRVVILEDEMLNLLQDAGIIGPNAMYFIKKYGIVNIRGYGITYDYNSTVGDSSPIGNNELVKYVFIDPKITKIGNKLFYHSKNLQSIHTGQATKVNRLLVNAIRGMVNGEIILYNSSIPSDAVVYPGTLKLNIPIDNHNYMLGDDTKGNVINKFNKQVVGTIDYNTGIINLVLYSSITATVTVEYRYCTLEKSDFESNYLPDNIISIGDQAFAQDVDKGYKGYGIKSLSFGSGIRSIGYACFWGSAIRSISIPKTINTIGAIGTYTFAHCEDLHSVSYKAVEIPDHAFNWCSSLVNFDIYDSCTKFGQKLFTYATSLETLYYYGLNATVENWLAINKSGDWASKQTNTETEYPLSGIHTIVCGSDGIFTNTSYTLGETSYSVYDNYPEQHEFQLTTYNGITAITDETSASRNAFIRVEAAPDTITILQLDVPLTSQPNVSYNDPHFVLGQTYNPTIGTELPLDVTGTSQTVSVSDTSYKYIYNLTGTGASSVLSLNETTGQITVNTANATATINIGLFIDGILVRKKSITITTEDSQ